MSTLMQPIHPVLAGIGPKHRAALARVKELEAEVERLREECARLKVEVRP
jgi:hypothetical protein